MEPQSKPGLILLTKAAAEIGVPVGELKALVERQRFAVVGTMGTELVLLADEVERASHARTAGRSLG